MIKLAKIDGSGRALDRTEAMAEAIKDAIYEHGEGMPLASIIGVLEIVKIEVMNDNS